MSESEIPAADTSMVTSADLDTRSEEAPAKAPEITPEQIVLAEKGVEAAFAAINSQPKVRIRVPKAHGPQVVIINGARFNIPSNIPIMVPQQVADILADAERV